MKTNISVITSHKKLRHIKRKEYAVILMASALSFSIMMFTVASGYLHSIGGDLINFESTVIQAIISLVLYTGFLEALGFGKIIKERMEVQLMLESAEAFALQKYFLKNQ